MDSMAEGMTDESDGLDDAEFLGEHEKYLQDCDKHEFEILKAEEARQIVRCILKFANVITASSRSRQFSRCQSS